MQARYQQARSHRGWTICLCLLTIIALATACTASQAQTLIGTPGAGWQTWNLATDPNNNYRYIDLNSNGAPYWDVPLLTFGGYDSTKYPANKSIGWCLTSTGDCQGPGSALYAPGPIPFWAMPYDSVNDGQNGTPAGAMDPKVYFRRNATSYTATLLLNTATNTYEINEFGWFETNAGGTVNGTKHVLFNGSGYPAGSATPDPVGTTVTFTPTQYFGFYFADESDPETQNGPEHGCWAYTIFTFNDEDCTAATGQGDHVFAIFRQSNSSVPTYWIAGQDPSMCNGDSDCNLTVVRLRRNSSR
jgi:hypothetical protein